MHYVRPHRPMPPQLMRDAQKAQPLAATRCAQVAVLPGLACLCASVGVVSGPCVQRDAPIVWLPGLGRTFASPLGRDWCLEVFMPFVILGALYTLLVGALTLLISAASSLVFSQKERSE